MSALGRKRTFAVQLDMSAKGQKRTHAVQQLGSLLDHLVGTGDERLRKGESERFRGLEIYHQLEFGRLLDRKIGRVSNFEYFIDVTRSAAEKIREILPIRHQKAVRELLSNKRYSWQAVCHSQCTNTRPQRKQCRSVPPHKAIGAILGHFDKHWLNVIRPRYLG